jgi:hypothetical protein
MFDGLSLGPDLRPGLYALQFSYQDQSVELAGAFVVTEKNTPVVEDLLGTQNVGQVLLVTPPRGIESFDSLAALDAHLLQLIESAAGHNEFMGMLPARYQALSPAGIWPLALTPIDSKPLFEHTHDALVDKRTQDIERAFSFADNPQRDAAQLVRALDRAIGAALPDNTARLELRAQALLEVSLRFSAPDWYRSASESRRATLAEHLGHAHRAHQRLFDLLGPAMTVRSLARHEWLSRLSDELEIDDLEPELLHLKTLRPVPGFGVYEHQRNLVELALRGPHVRDALPGSAFQTQTTLTYNDAPLPDTYKNLTPAWLAQQLTTLQPRIDFAPVQTQLHGRPEVRQAVEDMLDQRISALAYTAFVQGHLLENDLELIRSLRAGSDSRLGAATLKAATLSLHGAQLQDLWVLRQTDASGTLKRLLLCTPHAPRAQQFQAFDSEIDCQHHILGWAQDTGDGMADYLITRAPLRFRHSLHKVLAELSFKPDAQEYKKLIFTIAGSHAGGLKSMAEHVLATRVDDYDFTTPAWYRSTTAQNRQQLSTQSEDAEGTLRAFDAHPSSHSRFPSFTAYLHEQAKKSLNRLLKRSANDVDPDTVWAYSPPALVGNWTPAPLTYTQLYRDGYTDGVGFLDEKFSRSARFKGPQGIDLSTLTAENVARSVTGVWIGQRYIDKVKAELQSPESPGYAFRRDATLAITQRQMQSAALECRLQGHITSHDLLWLEKSITAMGETLAKTRNDYALHRLMIDGEWVIDTYLFSHAAHPVLLYTPHAPDGISFREARLFNYLLKKQPGMIDYLVERVGMPSRARVRGFLETAQKQLPDNLNKTSPSPARYDATRSVAAVADLRYALYDMKLQRKIDDVNATTVNRTQMITGLLWTCVEWVTAIATAPFPIVSLSAGLLLAFKDAMLALHAYQQGDTSAALEHFAGYLFNSAGALFTDLRPALRSLKPFAKPQRLASANVEQNQAMKLISQLQPVTSVPTDLRPVFYQGRPLWAPATPDALGRYLLYRIGPVEGKWVSTGRLVTPNADGVLVRSGLSGGAPKYESVPQTPGPHKDYGMAPKYWDRLELVMDPRSRAQMTSLGSDLLNAPHVVLERAATHLGSVRDAYLQQVERLTRDATTFFDELAPLPPRADVPVVEANSSLAQLIAGDAFTGNKHLVIGALPGSIASKQALIANMQTLFDQGFRRLYVEYLPGDVFRPKLDKFNAGESWRHIERHLGAIDTALGHAPGAEYSYLALVRKAREKGLSIMALDVSTSYHLEDVLLMADVSPTTPRANKLRNFYSHKVIEADAADAPDDRWIALVDHSRLRTFDNTPGLADLHNAVAVRIDDVAQARDVGIWVDTPGAIPGDALAKGDYRMALHTSYKAPTPATSKAAAPDPGVDHFSDFDIERSLRDDIANMADEPYGLDSRYLVFDPQRQPAFNAFVDGRSSLDDKARSFFTDYTPPARPTLPEITANTTPEAFLKQIADSHLPGVVLGEAHAAESSKALLKKQMKSLKKAGFKTLYVELLLTDLHQAELNIFHRTQRMPSRLKAYLRDQDFGHMSPFYTGKDTYTAVVQAAGKYGIRVRALDCTVSYHVKGLEDAETSRNRMFSYFAAKVIQADQLAQGPHKWIAFVGSAHTNYNLGVPGLADMLGAVSLHVRDVAPASAKGIHHGAWETVSKGLSSDTRALRSDFKLEVGIAGKTAPPSIASVSRSALTRPGHYLIERPTTTETRLVHWSGTGEIVSTPIQVDDQGLFFIARWDKQARRFKYLHELIEMLELEVPLSPVE